MCSFIYCICRLFPCSFTDVGMEKVSPLIQTHYHVSQVFYIVVLKDIRIDNSHKKEISV